MLLISTTKQFKGPAIVLRSAERCSRIRFTFSSGQLLDLGGSPYALSKNLPIRLISSSLPGRNTPLSELPNVLQANWHRPSLIPHHATLGHCLPSFRPLTPSCTSAQCPNRVANLLSGFRLPPPINTPSASKGWQQFRRVSRPRFRTLKFSDQLQLQSGLYFLLFQIPWWRLLYCRASRMQRNMPIGSRRPLSMF